ncbi:hypothetical protein EOW65_03630 [Sinirhodobacter ferrireducens]|uniref:Uncharacterized protein n=1 Tax=Paenirhodobacter ferrireducens TaxID=1215032 RepID=A0A443LRZ8_9RHOB|nr:hypothetical protein [Sinirhodobacter ferrireducens]RWR51952.1 hypothetical protein EOW65_03630 [Sinirhodobacter ferrireducens]
MSFDYPLTAREQARLEAVTDMIASRLASEGLTVDKADLLKLPSVRLFILSEGAGLPDGYLDEVKRSAPSVAEQMHKRELARQLENTESDLHKDLSRMNPHQRMAFGRELEAIQKAQKAAEGSSKPAMTLEEEATIINLIRRTADPATKINIARASGLIK